LRIGLTFLLTLLFSWVLFRAIDLEAALEYYAAMFGLAGTGVAAPLLAAAIYTPYHLVVLAWPPSWCSNPPRRMTGRSIRSPGPAPPH
jgi:hypothetical protein